MPESNSLDLCKYKIQSTGYLLSAATIDSV